VIFAKLISRIQFSTSRVYSSMVYELSPLPQCLVERFPFTQWDLAQGSRS